jgi:5-methylthioribose kinase
MSRFDHNFHMEEQDVIEYVKEKLDYFDQDAELTCTEIGDGNINFVYRVLDKKTNKSIIIKHATDFVRSSMQKASTDRNRIEAAILKIQGDLAPGYVPLLYLYDPVMCCIVMEDIGSYENMRYAMIQHKTFSTFSEDISTFMANTLIRTTDNVISPADKKAWVKEFINPGLCSISENLVYTDPYTNNSGRNILFEPNIEFFTKELYEDMKLHLEVAKLKDQFKSKAQALIHGDLHTGSIFVMEGSTMVLDPEFAFYGPIGYDVGNVIANLVFAWANAKVTMQDGSDKKTFMDWLEKTITDVIDLFKKKATDILLNESTDRMAKTPGFADWYVSDILVDTAGVAGLELNRRIVGSAKVKDIAGIEDADQRMLAERICVLAAKEFILKRQDKYQEGIYYIRTLHDVTESVTM